MTSVGKLNTLNDPDIKVLKNPHKRKIISRKPSLQGPPLQEYMCNSSQYRGGGTALLQYRVKVRFGEQVKFISRNSKLLSNLSLIHI